MPVTLKALEGSLLGTAQGDALGLPYEGLSPRRAARLLGEPDRYRLLPGRGMVSDDTEHACMTAQALIASGGDPDEFARRLAASLRVWLLGQPAGVGLATLRATLGLWVGFSPERSGVFSAGNGPAMRAPILGAAVEDEELLLRLVRVSTRITHTDPKAELGARAVAVAARLAADEGRLAPELFAGRIYSLMRDREEDEFLLLVERIVESRRSGESTLTFARSLGLGRGVSGYIYHTVPIVLHAWYCHPVDLAAAVTSVIRCGGDTDTTAAIVGGIVGAAVGVEGIPQAWLSGLWEKPRTVAWMKHLAERLHESRTTGTRSRPPRLPVHRVVPRNLLFLAIVLMHGFRRLLPPY